MAELEAAHGIAGSVRFEEREGGLPAAVLSHHNGSTATVYLFGANVASWTQPSGDEVLFVRPDAVFDRSKPISGGVPLCFPQFGPGPMQQHGFARNLEWEVLRTSADVNPDYPEPAVMLKLTSNEYTRGMWQKEFEATYEVTLRRDRLKLELAVLNTGGEELDFTAALHTYIEVTDATDPQVRVVGLQGKRYLDKVPDPENPAEKTEEREAVLFGRGLVDSVYLDTDPETLLGVGTGAAVAVENTSGFKDTVIWNPHDTLPDCWQSFVCVESAVVGKPVVLGPGQDWAGEVNLSVFDEMP